MHSAQPDTDETSGEMGRQIVDPATDIERMAVVETLARRLSRAVGDWQKHGEEADQLLAIAMLIVLGPETFRNVLNHVSQPVPPPSTTGDNAE